MKRQISCTSFCKGLHNLFVKHLDGGGLFMVRTLAASLHLGLRGGVRGWRVSVSVTHVMYSRVLVTVCVAHARVQRSQPLSRTAVVTRRRCTLSHRATLGWTYLFYSSSDARACSGLPHAHAHRVHGHTFPRRSRSLSCFSLLSPAACLLLPDATLPRVHVRSPWVIVYVCVCRWLGRSLSAPYNKFTFTLPAFLSPRRLPLSCLPARRRTITILSFDNGDSTHIA